MAGLSWLCCMDTGHPKFTHEFISFDITLGKYPVVPRLCFSKESFKELFGFGSKLLAGGLLHTIYLNLYSLVIGKYFSSADLGNFNRATSLAQYVSVNITSIITRVTYPIECQIQHDNEELQRKFFMFIRMTAFIIFPLMIWLMCTG